MSDIERDRRNERERIRWATDPEYRKRRNEKQRKRKLVKYHTDPEWEARHKEKQRNWYVKSRKKASAALALV